MEQLSEGFKIILGESVINVETNENGCSVVIHTRTLSKAQYLHRELVHFSLPTSRRHKWDIEGTPERHDQQVDSGDNYTDVMEPPVGMVHMMPSVKEIGEGLQKLAGAMAGGEQPYTPKVGEECKISNCGNPYIWCKIEYMGKDLCVVSHEIHKEQHYHLSSAVFQPLKTERDICMDAIKEGLTPSVYESQKNYYGFAVEKLIDAGLIK